MEGYRPGDWNINGYTAMLMMNSIGKPPPTSEKEGFSPSSVNVYLSKARRLEDQPERDPTRLFDIPPEGFIPELAEDTNKTLNEMYNALDLYVVSSRYEGMPQAIVESALSYTPIISTDVGIASQILAPESISKEISAESLMECNPNIEIAYNNAIQFKIPDGFNFFRSMSTNLC